MTLRKQFEKATGCEVDFTVDDIVEDFVMGFEYYEKYSEWLEKKLQNASSNSDYECHRDEFENIMCDIESAFHANAATCKSILGKSLHSIKSYTKKHFA